MRLGFLVGHPIARLPRSRRRRARGHRRRGALRRHGALRRSARSASPGSALVLPALLLNYFGQGALLLDDRGGGREPVLPAGAGVGALSARRAGHGGDRSSRRRRVISGAFSLTQQAMQLGYAPRMKLEHTSRHRWGRSTCRRSIARCSSACVALVLGFGSSTNLAAAYGIAVTGTMAITTILAFVVARRMWNWSLPASVALIRRIPARGRQLLLRQPRQDRRRRLVPAGVRRLRLPLHDDVEARPRAPERAARGRLDPARRLRRKRVARLRESARSRDLHDGEPGGPCRTRCCTA